MTPAPPQAAEELIDFSRNNQGPIFMEAISYRWRGHVGYREDIDVGVKRGKELWKWRDRDPVGRLKDAMLSFGMITDADFNLINRELDILV